MDTNETRPRRARREGAGNWIWIAVVVVAVLGGAAAYYFLYSGNSDEPAAGEGGSGVVNIPQEPSLLMVVEDGTLYVENDGNVTMSDVEVRDATGAVICEIGTMSPGDSEPCEDAGDRQDLVVAGQGPKGQKVEETAPAG